MRPDEAAIIHSWNNDPDVYQFWGSYDYRHKSLDEFLADTVGDAHFFDGSDVANGRCFSIEPLVERHAPSGEENGGLGVSPNPPLRGGELANRETPIVIG